MSNGKEIKIKPSGPQERGRVTTPSPQPKPQTGRITNPPPPKPSEPKKS